MSSISDTIERLSALRKGLEASGVSAGTDRLADMSDFGNNPGALRARTFVPGSLAEGAALVVVLHGCTQTAAGYDHGSGWSSLAERHGFALLLPEQRRANNSNLCFNWFEPDDARRGRGEALSIRQMVQAMVERHGLDGSRVFVTGLSAGGAMTAVMLATYPEVFAGGAVIAGLPYGTAWSVQDALTRMRGAGLPDEPALGALARNASGHRGNWPTLSVWHGDADRTVSPTNAEALLGQWRALHGLGPAPSETQRIDGHRRRVWRDENGREVVDAYSIAGMGHGTPLDPAGAEGCGASGPHMLDVGLSSTRLIAARWGLATGAHRAEPQGDVQAVAPDEEHDALGKPRLGMPPRPASAIERTISDALRTAGLLR